MKDLRIGDIIEALDAPYPIATHMYEGKVIAKFIPGTCFAFTSAAGPRTVGEWIEIDRAPELGEIIMVTEVLPEGTFPRFKGLVGHLEYSKFVPWSLENKPGGRL